MKERLNIHRRDCIDSCTQCHNACTRAIAFLQRGGGPGQENLLNTLLDCADLCRASADFMLRDSPLQGHLCAICAKICERCAARCEGEQAGVEILSCAEACRRCAESCRLMAMAPA